MDRRILNARVTQPVIERLDSGSNAITTIAHKLDPGPAQDPSEADFWDAFPLRLRPEE